MSLLHVAIITPDENLGRGLMEKVRSFFPGLPVEVTLLTEAKPALWYVERHHPDALFVSNQIPGAEIEALLASLNQICPHALLVLMSPEHKGQGLSDSHPGRLCLGVPILDWDFVHTLLESEIPSELKARYGVVRRDTMQLRKLKAYAEGLRMPDVAVAPPQSYMPLSLEARDTATPTDPLDSRPRQRPDAGLNPQAHPVSWAPLARQEWALVLSLTALSLISFLAWAQTTFLAPLRWPLALMAGLSWAGIMLRPLRDSKTP